MNMLLWTCVLRIQFRNNTICGVAHGVGYARNINQSMLTHFAQRFVDVRPTAYSVGSPMSLLE